MTIRTKMAVGAVSTLMLFGACGGSGDRTSEVDTASSTSPQSSPSEDSAPATSGGSEVTLQTFRFEPGEIEIEVGETVTWTNNDDILHTVTSGKGQKQGVPGVSENKDAQPDGLFDQQMDGVGATFEFTFEKSGTFNYFCSIHPGMTGKVIVE